MRAEAAAAVEAAERRAAAAEQHAELRCREIGLLDEALQQLQLKHERAGTWTPAASDVMHQLDAQRGELLGQR